MKSRLPTFRLPIATVTALFAGWLTACATRIATPQTPVEPAQVLPIHDIAKAPAPAEFSSLTLPALQREMLANGVTLVTIPSARAPYVQVQLVVDAGRLLFGSNADVLAEMLRLTGSAESPEQWQQQWRELGATLLVRSGPHRLIFSAEVLPYNADALLHILHQMWHTPNLRSAELLARVQRNLRVQQHEQDLLGGDYVRLWQRLAYGEDHPYGSNALSRQALYAVTLETVQQSWHHARSEKQQWLFAGNLSRATLSLWRSRLERDPTSAPVARWRQLATTFEIRNRTNPIANETPPSLMFHLLHAEDAKQVNVMLGHVLVPRQPQTHWLGEAFADTLGMSFSGRLFADLRERRGLSYDVGGYYSAAPLASELVLRGSTRPEHTGAFVHGLLAHLRLLETQAPHDDEMQLLRGSLRGQLRVQMETARQRSRQYNAVDLLGDEWQSLAQRDQFWQKLQPTSLPAFAEHWLHAAPVIVLRGDVTIMEKQLRNVFPTATFARYDDVP